MLATMNYDNNRIDLIYNSVISTVINGDRGTIHSGK